jgi:hypothetical protein
MGKRYLITVILLVLVLVAALTGCANQPDPTTTGGETALGSEEPELRLTQTLPAGLERVQPTESNPTVGEVPAKILDEIIADLLKRTRDELQDIKVIRSEAVVWNDGSLGSPKPGEFYIQVPVNGYWVVLIVEGIEYDYRVSDTGDFFLCEEGYTSIDPVPLMPVASHGKMPKGGWTQEP